MRSCDVRAVVMLFALFAVVLPVASAKSAAAPSAVHLTSDGADGRLGTITDDAFAAVEFFAPWCPHCQNFGPTWETVASYFNTGEHAAGGVPPTPRVTVYSVDCVAERDLCPLYPSVAAVDSSRAPQCSRRFIPYKATDDLRSSCRCH